MNIKAMENKHVIIDSKGHVARMSSLPSIEEDDHVDPMKISHRKAPSSFSGGSRKRFSLKALSVGSVGSSETSNSITSQDLLSNMMTSYKDRNPYEYYTVLDKLGEGSIGSVEKVTRKHHHGFVKEKQSALLFGGIFHDCCVGSNDGQSSPSLLQKLLSKLTNNENVFQPNSTSKSSVQVDSTRSNASENSNFSAPDLNNTYSNGSGDWNSIHSESHLTSKQRSPQHTLRRYALKSIRLDRTTQGLTSADEAELRNEISILRSLDHPHIVHIIETYEYDRSIYLLIDLCEGGDLYVMDPYAEGEAKSIMGQLVGAVTFMHKRGVAHRDLKYENVMFVDRSDRKRMSIKLIDFGLSMKYRGGSGNDKSMTDFVGTIYTMAPEVLQGKYNFKCDLWSLGVMAYMLLSSQIPFVGRDMSAIAKEIMEGHHSFSGKKWSGISKQGKNFIDSLLVKDVSKRLNGVQALQHPWITASKRPSFHRRHSSECIGGTYGTTKMAPRVNLDVQICKSIEMFATYSWLHRLALMVIGYKYTGKETDVLREVFLSFDYKKTGTVEVDELRYAFALYDKYGDEEIDDIFAAVDMNGEGEISWTEFLAATIEAIGIVGEEEFADCFDRLDCDNSGFISTENLKEILGDLPESVFDKIIEESDLTRDHKISRFEFMALLDEKDEYIPADKRKPLHFQLRRASSADDLDFLLRLKSDRIANESSASFDSDPPDEIFLMEKAKSVRKLMGSY